MKSKRLTLLLSAVAAIVIVVGGSFISAYFWGGKPEKIETVNVEILSDSHTPIQIAKQNQIPLNPVIKALGIDSVRASTVTLAELGLTPVEAKSKIEKMMVLYSEEQSKNWLKIFLKFVFWFTILIIPFVLMVKMRLTPRKRLLLVGGGVVIFGIVLGSDPSPMGTVKDAVYLLTAHKAVFIPRIIALAIFLAMVVVANKFICSWGCQFGLLQEFMFRLNRNRKDLRGKLKQYKVPFWISNTVRIAVFIGMTAAGLLWAFDIFESIDPFKIFNPSHMIWIGIAFVAVLLLASLFVYRPWCHFFCPFGLVSWLFEKLAIFRIKVDYNKCIACMACSKGCPSTVMDAILKKDRIVPDCFSCGTCIESCPTDAIRFSSSRKDEGDFAVGLANKRVRKERSSRSSE